MIVPLIASLKASEVIPIIQKPSINSTMVSTDKMIVTFFISPVPWFSSWCAVCDIRF